jgi:uncharacterized protein
MMTIDTSGMLALLDARSRPHRAAVEALEATTGPFLVPAATLGELGYFFEHRYAPVVARTFLEDLRDGLWTLDGGDGDLARVVELHDRYADLPLGVVDAAVIACGERSGGAVLSFDRDFLVVGAEGTIQVVPRGG